MGPLVRCLEKVAPALTWQQGYRSMPGNLDRKFGYAELMGPNGPVMADKLILGCVLFGPQRPFTRRTPIQASRRAISVCRERCHKTMLQSITPGSLILNTPDFDHKITSCALEPTLVAYAWVGDVQTLVSYKMAFNRRRRGTRTTADQG